MAGTFSRVEDKLDWAKEKVREVGQRIERFQEAEGGPFRAKPHPRAGSKQAIQVLWSPATAGAMPLDDLAHCIGDAVHNLRAALDYLVYELNIRRRGGFEPRSLPFDHPLRKTGFPIFGGDKEFEGKAQRGPGARKMFGRLTVDQRTRIKKLQPFGKPNHPLWVLAELDNLGKHRHALVLLRLDRVWLDRGWARSFGFKTVEGVKPGRRYKEGTKVTLLTQPQSLYNPSRVQAEVNMALKRKITVLFDEGSPAEGRDVVKELRRLQSHVTWVINRFKWDFHGI